MAAKTDITYRPAPDTSPEQARDARARAWAFVFQCRQKKVAAEGHHPDSRDGTKFKEDSANAAIIPDE